ncbi:hypothetical protein NADE_005763 [Nannochloris sp. 'desiccata']|nr:hypothetical protein NADE_005763 [Chlorella desiccata (nom. nud.)]
MVSSEGKKPPSVSKQPPVPKHYRVLKILGLVAAAGSISFTLATSDVITVATVVIIPLVVWFVRTLFGKIDRVAEDMAELIKFMHRSEVTTVKDVAASESRTNRIIHLALAGKHPSTDAESASDNP